MNQLEAIFPLHTQMYARKQKAREVLFDRLWNQSKSWGWDTLTDKEVEYMRSYDHDCKLQGGGSCSICNEAYKRNLIEDYTGD